MAAISTYYNDNNAYVAEWLINLSTSGIISDGIVDMRPIQSVSPSDLIPFTRCHFFAGIGGWDYALKLAGWPDDRPVWTGSCPCQPFSVAGKRKGVDDERHLWPEFLRLIAERRPPIIFGEQVASADGRDWLAGVFFDLEDLGYAVAGADYCAAGCGAPHIRQRLYWVAKRLDDSTGSRCNGERIWAESEARNQTRLCGSEPRCSNGGVADANGRQQGNRQLQRSGQHGQQQEDYSFDRVADSQHAQWRSEREINSNPYGRNGSGRCGDVGRLDDSASQQVGRTGQSRQNGPDGLGNNNNKGLEGRGLPECECSDQFSPWSSGTPLLCLDGKARRIEPRLQPLAHGVPSRASKLRAIGNSIVPQVAATFIRAFMETESE